MFDYRLPQVDLRQELLNARVKRYVSSVMAAEEAEIARMLPLWPEWGGKPHLARDQDQRLLGLCTQCEIGEAAKILVKADPAAIPYPHNDIRLYRPRV